MTRTVQGAIDWARQHPRKDVGETSISWAGWCAALVFWAGGFARSFTTAMAAGDWQIARSRLNSDWTKAPSGAIHYWAGVGGDGHTAIQVNSAYLLLMASAAVTDSFGNAIGTISFQDYARKGIPYRGWSMYWGDETLDLSGTSGGGTVPIGNTNGERPMQLLRVVDGRIFLVTDNGKSHIPSPQVLGLLQRLLKTAPGDYDTFNAAEVDMITAQIVAADNINGDDTAAILKAIADKTFDTNAIVAAAAAGAAKGAQEAIDAAGVTVEIDYAKIEEAAGRGADAALADDFAALPGEVADEQAERLQS